MNFKITNEKTGACEGYAIVKSSEIKTTAKGAPYLDMTLADTSGEINAKIWDYSGEPYEDFSFVKVKGTLSSFNDVEQLRVDNIRLVTDADSVNIEDYVPCAVLDGITMYDELIGIVYGFEDANLKLLVGHILETNKTELLYWPAAKTNHHAVRGGLLMHSLSILKLAEGICKVYQFVNKDLLYAGAILHDIAKLWEMKVAPIGIASDYTTMGNLLGHLVGGAIYVDRIGRELGIDEEILLLVEHMLISHHGQPDWGAAKVPMFVEAEILSQLDVLDARMYEMHAAISETEAGEFSPPQRPLGGKTVYNHGYYDSDETVLV